MTRENTSPFGVADGNDIGIQFKGSADELNDALDNWLVVPKRHTIKVKTKSGKIISVIPPVRRQEPVVADKPLKTTVKKKKKSFKDGATEGELERAKHLITNIIEVPEAQRKAYIDSLDQLTRDLTNFLVTEIAPFESAIQAAIDDAETSVKLITGVREVSFDLGRAARIIDKLPELKTIDYVCTRMNIAPDIRLSLIAEYLGNDHTRKLSEMQQLQQMHRQAKEPDVSMREVRERKSTERKEAAAKRIESARYKSDLATRRRAHTTVRTKK